MVEQTPEWGLTRKKVLNRDEQQCRYCKIPAEDIDEGREGGLHIHHIIPRSEFESQEHADSLSNLVTLCPSCHRRWEKLELRMATPPAGSVESRLGEKTSRVLDVFKDEWRANPLLVREETGLSKQQVNKSINQLMSMGLVEKVSKGLYEYSENA